MVATAGAFSFGLTVPGGAQVGVGRGHRRERAADAPAARPPAADDGRAARRRRRGGASRSPCSPRPRRRSTSDSATASPRSRAVGSWRRSTPITGRVPPTVRFRLVDGDAACEAARTVYDGARGDAHRRGRAAAGLVVAHLQTAGSVGARFFTVVHTSPDGRPDGFARLRRGPELAGRHPGHDAARDRACRRSTTTPKPRCGTSSSTSTSSGTCRGSTGPSTTRCAGASPIPAGFAVHEVATTSGCASSTSPDALAARTYGTEDGLVIELADAFRPANSGRWRIDGAARRRRRPRPPTSKPTSPLSAPELGALYLGGVAATTLAARGADHELGPRARCGGPTASSSRTPRPGAAPTSERRRDG